MSADEMPAANAPLSWRDVYKAVGESEARILKAIADSVGPITQRQIDHEGRLRIIERGELAWFNQSTGSLKEVVSDHERRLSNAETAVLDAQSKVKGAALTLSAGKQIALIVSAASGTLIGLYSFIEKFTP